MKQLILIWILLIAPLTHYAQEQETPVTGTNNDRISLSVGFNKSLLKDFLYAPLNYSTSGIAFSLEYQRYTTKENQWYADVNVVPSVIKTDASAYFNADRIYVDLAFGYLQKLSKQNEPLQLQVGGGYHSYLDIVFYEDINSLTFFVSHGLELKGQLSYEINAQNKVQTTLGIPVLAILVRPAHTGWDDFIIDNQDNYLKIATRGFLTSLNKFQIVNWENEFRHQLSKRLDLLIQHKLTYHKTKEQQLAKNLNNQVLFGSTIKF